MQPTGAALAADLSPLLAVGRIDLPQMAYTYTKLNRAVAGTADGDADAFGGGPAPKGDGGSLGQVYHSWSTLRNLLQDALGNTARGLEDAGAAIVSIVNGYTEADTTAGNLLRAAWRNGPPPGMILDGDEQLPATLPPIILTR